MTRPACLLATFLLTLGGCRPTAWSAAVRPAAARPACPIPEQDLVRRARLDVHAAWGLTFVRERVDLDHDGVADLLLSTNAQCGSGGCEWHLYLQRGACARWQGSAFGRYGGTQPGPGRFRELLLSAHNGSCDAEEIVLRHDGRQYRPHRSRRCRCVETPGGRDPGPDEGCTPWSRVRASAVR